MIGIRAKAYHYIKRIYKQENLQRAMNIQFKRHEYLVHDNLGKCSFSLTFGVFFVCVHLYVLFCFNIHFKHSLNICSL